MRTLLLALLGLTACTPSQPELPSLSVLEDTDPSSTVVHLSIRAQVGSVRYGDAAPTEVWTYNGTVPGPLIEANVGDRLVVDFQNDLPESTTIHWHGVRVPNTMDGVPLMDNAVPAGGSFRYEFTLKDSGLFWFHPHVRSAIQVQKGLYGVIRVRGPAEPASDLEQVLVLDDIKLRADGSISEYLDDASAMIGRQGNTLLANGVVHPLLRLPAGGVTRLRVVNTANARYFTLGAVGLKFLVFGTDGSPYAEPFEAETVMLVPGERLDLFVKGPPSGDVELMALPYERGHMTGSASPLAIATLRFSGKPTATEFPSPSPPIEALPVPASASFRIALSEKAEAGNVRFFVNEKQWPDVAAWTPGMGVSAFEVVNESEMDHPFHLHGFFFQVLNRSDVAEPSARRVWKDTINIPAKSSIKAIARFDEPGRWMYHCHILEHAEGGMMGEVSIP
ncbi:MAG: multicopper oxidase family protein [Myxococcota bacterium]|jgi:FtsP/CotA-like multicopper oxidase with cupredoxin domain